MGQVEIRGNGSRFSINQPLCGWDWLREHLPDHTHAEIEGLTLSVSSNDRWLPPINSTAKRGAIKTIVRGLR